MKLCVLLCVFGLACAVAGAASEPASSPPDNTSTASHMDVAVEQLLELLARGEIIEAAEHSREIARAYPRLRLAQWLYAELASVAAMDTPRMADASAWSDAQISLMLEARTRLETYLQRQQLDTHTGAIPRSLAHLGDDISDVVLVDLGRSELLYFSVRDGQPQLEYRHYVSSGSAGFGKQREGDLRTPLGVYRIDGYRDGKTLPALYGDGALMLDYPNALDTALGRTGSGIWLHGIPTDTLSRSPWSSEGCVTMSNDHLLHLARGIEQSTALVVLTDHIEWIDSATRAELQQRWQAAIRHAGHPQLRARIIGARDAAQPDSAPLETATLLEIPDIAGRRWLGWLPAGTSDAVSSWRYVPLPTRQQPAEPRSAIAQAP